MLEEALFRRQKHHIWLTGQVYISTYRKITLTAKHEIKRKKDKPKKPHFQINLQSYQNSCRKNNNSSQLQFSWLLLSESIVSSFEKLNLLVAPKVSASCDTVLWHASLVGRKASGREGMHSGRNSVLLKVGAYSASTVRQNMNLQIQVFYHPSFCKEKRNRKEDGI